MTSSQERFPLKVNLKSAYNSSLAFNCDAHHCRAVREALVNPRTGRNRYRRVVPDAEAAQVPGRPLRTTVAKVRLGVGGDRKCRAGNGRSSKMACPGYT
jgi:hypothetical protein